jgi:hypothetical protein
VRGRTRPAEDSLPQVTPYGRLIDGFGRSLERFRDVAYEDPAPVETYIPLFETLNWAASIADRIGKGNKPELLRAIEYARNAVHHEWIRAFEFTPRRYGEGGYGEGPFGGSIWRWKPSEHVEIRKGDADRRPLYESLLADRPALDTLRRLEAELPDEHD